MIKEYFARYEENSPEQRAQLRQVSLPLRRDQIDTMEHLCRLCRNNPDRLRAIRSISAKRLGLIEQVCRQYEKGHVPGVAVPDLRIL